MLQLKQPEQADAELLALVAHKDASAVLCLAALSAVLQAPRCSALRHAADLVLERFAEDATMPVRLVRACLGASQKEVCILTCDRTSGKGALYVLQELESCQDFL